MVNLESVQRHYAVDSLNSLISKVLAEAALDSGPLTWADLAPFDQFHVRGLQATIDLAQGLGATASDRVLDVGCGLGGPSRYLVTTVGCHVTGIDLSEPFIEAGKMLSAKCNLSDLTEFVQGDALAMPFPGESFDHAWTQHVAMNIADRAGLYSSIFRVLKPGGKLAIYDVVAGPGGPLIFPVPWAGDASISFLLTPDSMRSVLESCGFKELSWLDTTEQGLAALAEQRAVAGPLNLAVIMGEGFGERVGNLARNLKEGRAKLVETVYQKG